MTCAKCNTEMSLTKWGLPMCVYCEFKSNEEGDPKELNFDEVDYSTIREEEL